MDLAEGHVMSIDLCEKLSGLNIINLGSGIGSSVLNVVKTFEKTTGKNINFQIAPRRGGDVSVSYASIQKAITLMNWSPKRSLEEICKSAWRWQLKLSNNL